jgi:hypothetical protein
VLNGQKGLSNTAAPDRDSMLAAERRAGGLTSGGGVY